MFIKIIGVAVFLFSMPAFSQVALWQEDTSSTEIPPAFEDTISSIRITLNPAGLLAIAAGDSVEVTLETGMTRTAVIDTINSFEGIVQIIGHLPSELNSLIEIQIDGLIITASVQLGMNEIGYRLEVTPNDSTYLLKQEISEFICGGIPPAPENSVVAKESGLSVVGALATVSSVPIYNSNQGASRVIYLDFDGETVANTPWNSQYNGGAPIVAQPYDEDGSPSTFNDFEQNYIREVWERAKEAYSIYQVNVTTDANVFNATAISQRHRMLITPTHAWYGASAGGVAYIPSFGTGWPAWGFTIYDGSPGGPNMGLISIHELGHTLNLEHDGLNGSEYHPGQPGWGPFMGGPYGSSYTTFSNGDYAGADEFQPDLSIISGFLPFKADSVGNTSSTASSASPDTIIESEVGALNDKDVYQFQAKQGQKIVINVTALGSFPTVNTQSILYDSAGIQLAVDDQIPASPPPFPASISLNSNIEYQASQTDTYYLHINGNGYNGGPNYNHSAYGVVGRYSLEVLIDGINIVPILYLLLFDDEEPA